MLMSGVLKMFNLLIVGLWRYTMTRKSHKQRHSERKQYIRNKDERRKQRAIETNAPDLRVDDLFVELNKKGKLKKSIGGSFDEIMWHSLVEQMPMEMIDYVLSFEQHRNWNAILYRMCEERKGLRRVRIAIHDKRTRSSKSSSF